MITNRDFYGLLVLNGSARDDPISLFVRTLGTNEEALSIRRGRWSKSPSTSLSDLSESLSDSSPYLSVGGNKAIFESPSLICPSSFSIKSKTSFSVCFLTSHGDKESSIHHPLYILT